MRKSDYTWTNSKLLKKFELNRPNQAYQRSIKTEFFRITHEKTSTWYTRPHSGNQSEANLGKVTKVTIL